MIISDFSSRVSEQVKDALESIKLTLDNIKKYKKDEKLDFELINVLKDREVRLKSKYEYFRFVNGDMSDNEAKVYSRDIQKLGGSTAGHMMGDIRDYVNITVVKHNLENTQQWILEVDKIIIWINNGYTHMPPAEEQNANDFFKLEQYRKAPEVIELGETIDFEVNTNYVDLDKITEYIEKNVEKSQRIIYENKFYISVNEFSKVKPLVEKLNKYIKLV